LIQQIRNEAHRFGINFHHVKRSSVLTASELDNIKGVGPKTKELLLKKFGSPGKIKNTPKEELEKLIGKRKAEIIAEFYRNKL
jgi:excinuclease ABC subunit C